MSMLGDFLPKVGEGISSTVSGIGNSISNAASSASNFISSGTSNFNLASMSTKIGEGATKMLGSFGSLMGFKNVAPNLPSADLATLLQQQGIGIGAGQTLSDNTELAAPRSDNNDVVVVLQSTISPEYVRLNASPRISENRAAQYSEVNLIHHPGAILKYERTSARSWGVSAKLVSRNQQEASENQMILNIIRGWVMPYYGEGTEKNDPDKLGAPPPVLMFSGYGEKNIAKIPVVLESYNTDWPNECDYIPTLTGDPFPVVMDVSLTLKECYSPAEYSNFNLFAYKSGMLSQAFNGGEFSVGSSSTANDNLDTSEPAILGNISAASGVPNASELSGKANGLVNDVSGAISSATSAIQDKLSAVTKLTSSSNPAPADLKDFMG